MTLAFSEDLFCFPAVQEALYRWLVDKGEMGERELFLLEHFCVRHHQLTSALLAAHSDFNMNDIDALNRQYYCPTTSNAFDQWELIQRVAKAVRERKELDQNIVQSTPSCSIKRL